MLDQITRNAEDILDLLELPYRVVAVCTGDMGAKNYKQYDIETWMPSRNAMAKRTRRQAFLTFKLAAAAYVIGIRAVSCVIAIPLTIRLSPHQEF